MFAALAKFRVIDRTLNAWRVTARPADFIACNDNAPVHRTALARSLRPVLVGRWRRNVGSGRLEWHWTIECPETASSEEPEPWPSFGGPPTLPIGHTVQGISCRTRGPQRLVIQTSYNSTLFGD
jgi:hypothetical protein